jgi:endogenous inhibitor of DNA gyrase (YacG/DUF329 family)
MAKERTVNCPQCGAKVKWLPENRFRPFCSERCKQIDLGAWAAEDYRVATVVEPPDGKSPSGDVHHEG